MTAKRIWTICVLSLLLCSLIGAALPANAETGWSAALKIERLSVDTNQKTVTVRVSVEQITCQSGIFCASFDVHYDNTVLELISWENSKPAGWKFTGSNPPAEDWTKIKKATSGKKESYLAYTLLNSSTSGGVKTSGTLYTDLHFKVLKSAAASTEISVTGIQFSDVTVLDQCRLPDQKSSINLKGNTTSSENSNGGTSNGGTSNGGSSNGETSNGGTTSKGGSSNGESSSGGTSNGGSSNGGSSNGGSSNGGSSNGGSSNGGSSNGGSSNGGSSNGETSEDDEPSQGEISNGEASNEENAGGEASAAEPSTGGASNGEVFDEESSGDSSAPQDTDEPGDSSVSTPETSIKDPDSQAGETSSAAGSNTSSIADEAAKTVRMWITVEDIADPAGVSSLLFKLTYQTDFLQLIHYECLLPDDWNLNSEFTEDLTQPGDGKMSFWIANHQAGHGVKENGVLGFYVEFSFKGTDFDPSLISIENVQLINDEIREMESDSYRLALRYEFDGETYADEEFSSAENEGRTLKIWIAVISVIVVLAAAAAAFVILRKKKLA